MVHTIIMSKKSFLPFPFLFHSCGSPQKWVNITLTKGQRVQAYSCYFEFIDKRFYLRCGYQQDFLTQDVVIWCFGIQMVHRGGSVPPSPKVRFQAFTCSFKDMTGVAAHRILGLRCGCCTSCLNNRMLNSGNRCFRY